MSAVRRCRGLPEPIRAEGGSARATRASSGCLSRSRRCWYKVARGRLRRIAVGAMLQLAALFGASVADLASALVRGAVVSGGGDAEQGHGRSAAGVLSSSMLGIERSTSAHPRKPGSVSMAACQFLSRILTGCSRAWRNRRNAALDSNCCKWPKEAHLST